MQHTQITSPNITGCTKLAAGSSGVVDKCSTGTDTVVRKKLKDTLLEEQTKLYQECKIMQFLQRFNHPHIANLFISKYVTEQCQTQNQQLREIFLQYYNCGTLDKYKEISDPTKLVACTLFKQLAEAVAFIHEKKIVHLDIKEINAFLHGAEKCTIDVNTKVYLGDFGLARFVELKKKYKLGGALGTFGYIAPEMYHAKLGDLTKLDIYAMGIVFFQLLTGQSILKILKAPTYTIMQGESEVTFTDALEKYKIGSTKLLTPTMKILLNAMCCYNPDERYNAKQVLEATNKLYHEILLHPIQSLEENMDNLTKEKLTQEFIELSKKIKQFQLKNPYFPDRNILSIKINELRTKILRKYPGLNIKAMQKYIKYKQKYLELKKLLEL